MLRASSLTAFLLALSIRAAADSTEAGWKTGLDLKGGIATAPFYTENLPEATGHGAMLVGHLAWREEDGLGIGLSVPVVSVNVRQPAGSYVNEAAWGNPLLWVERRAKLGRVEVGRLDGWVRAGIAAPLAESGPHLLRYANRALAIADAIDGWQNRELFVPGFVPLPVTGGASLERGVLRAETSVKLVPMFRVGDADLEPAQLHPFALSMLTVVGASVRPGRSVAYGLWTWLVVDAIPPAASSRARTVQWVVSPDVAFRFGDDVQMGTSLALPIAGALGGKSFAVAIRASAAW